MSGLNRILLIVVGFVGVPESSRAQPVTSMTVENTPGRERHPTSWPASHSTRGTRGIYRVEAASPGLAGDITLLVGGSYSYSRGLFLDQDVNEYQREQIGLVWAMLDNVELWLNQSIVSNRNTAADPQTSQTLGNPALGVKVGFLLAPDLALGGGVAAMIPTSAHGAGLDPGAISVDAYAMGSYRATSWFSVSLNAGYRLDNSEKVFNRDLTPVQRFAGGISQKDLLLAGVGASTAFALGDTMTLGPFAELAGGVALGADLDESPLRAAGGIKWFPFGGDSVELAVGGDFAILGTPKSNGRMAGIPPWDVFAHLGVHLKPTPVEVVTEASSCAQDAGCPSGQKCVGGVCSHVTEVVKEVVREVAQQKSTFRVTGRVVDKVTGDPIGSATVRFSNVKGSALAVDYKTGKFQSWPIPTGEGIVKLVAQAPGYANGEQAITKGKANQDVETRFQLSLVGQAAKGVIRGSLKDARTGKPIRNGQVFIPAVKTKVRSDKDGKFEAEVTAGRYQVLISNRKYVTQKKEIEIRPGDVVILNIDMTSKR